MLYYEKKLKRAGFNVVIGVDEAGRGPLAGPVVAAAVALKAHQFKNRIDDSKKLNPSQRKKAYLEITENSTFGIGIVNERIIERINILESTRVAMEHSIAELLRKLPSGKKEKIHVIVDGNINLDIRLPYTRIIKGDAKSKSIASASILAKVTRDRIMDVYDKIYPGYNFAKHKGYSTSEHRALIKKNGKCLIHRKTFVCE